MTLQELKLEISHRF